MNKALEIKNLSVAYNGRPALEGITLSAPRGAMLGAVGPNGRGEEHPVIKAVLGLVRPGMGTVEILGRRVDRQVRKLVGYVPQREDVD